VTRLQRNLVLLLDGRLSFDAFARETRLDFERMAAYLIRRWIPPTWCTHEDIVQELLVGAWIWVWQWEDGRGPTLSRYVTYNAIGHAKRALHKARGAKLSGSADKNPSRIERALSTYHKTTSDEHDDIEERMLDRLAVEPEAEASILAREAVLDAVKRALPACETDEERMVLAAIARAGGLDEAGLMLYDDPDTRLTLWLSSEERGVHRVLMVAADVAARMTASEENRS
jgi:DNA-directed RNA polymerase specialized sigma24 family protein